MRTGILVIGIVLLVAGGIFFVIGYNAMQPCQRYPNYCDEEEYWGFLLMEACGGAVALAGLILSIAGAVSSKIKVGTDTSEEIKKLAELHKDGVLTDREFRKRKRRLLK